MKVKVLLLLILSYFVAGSAFGLNMSIESQVLNIGKGYWGDVRFNLPVAPEGSILSTVTITHKGLGFWGDAELNFWETESKNWTTVGDLTNSDRYFFCGKWATDIINMQQYALTGSTRFKIDVVGLDPWKFGSVTAEYQAAPVPEPVTALLLLVGISGLGIVGKKRLIN